MPLLKRKKRRDSMYSQHTLSTQNTGNTSSTLTLNINTPVESNNNNNNSVEQQLTTTTTNDPPNGLFSSLVNAAHHAASSLVTPQKPSEKPGSPPSFLQHLDSLLSHDSSSSKRLHSHSASPEPNPEDDDDLNSVKSRPKSIAGEVVFQPLRKKPITTLGKGELTLHELGFADVGANTSSTANVATVATPPFEKRLSLNTTNSPVIIEPTPIEAKSGTVMPLSKNEMSPELEKNGRSSVFPDERPKSYISESQAKITRFKSIDDEVGTMRSVSPPINTTTKRSMSPKNFLKNRRNTTGSTTSKDDVSMGQEPLALTDTIQTVLSDTNYEGVSIPSTKRQAEFHHLFPLIPQHEALLEDFSCALQKDILIHGKIYLSQRHLSFNSNILGWTTNLSIPLKEVVQIEKKTIAGLFPNSIAIRSLHQRYLFASLLQRDSTFAVILNVWRQVVKTERGDDALENAGGGADQGSAFSDYGSDEEDEEEEEMARLKDVEVEDGEEDEDDDDYDDSSIYDVNKPDDDVPGPSGSGTEGEVLGPLKHKPTEFEHDSVTGETKILERSVELPLGKVFQLLFGNDVTFLKNSIEKQKNHSLSEIPTFTKFEKDESRSYSYVKPLNSPVGPKETVCQVEEIIQNFDLTEFVEVLQKVKTPDVPSGSSFIINTSFYLSWDVKNTTKVVIFTNVEWIGKSWIKAAVEKGTTSGQKDSLNKLIDDIDSTTTTTSNGPAEEDVTMSKLPTIGPKTHAATSAPIKPKSSETQVLDDIIPAPLGTTFMLLFNDNDTSLFQSILTKQKNYNIGAIPGFTNKKRNYEYTKPINAPIGPKETRCLVAESVESLDLNQYILVVQTTQTPDVPSGNSFSTVTSIYMSWAENNQTKIVVLTEVQWRGRSWIKGAVEKGAIEGQKESMAIMASELKEYIAKNGGGKKVKKVGAGKRGRASTRSTVTKIEEGGAEGGMGGLLGNVMALVEPVMSIIGVDVKKWTLSNVLSWCIVSWFVVSIVMKYLFGGVGVGRGRSVMLNDVNRVMINGEEFLLMPKVTKILENQKRKDEAEYDIWEWIEKRRGGIGGGGEKSTFGKDHSEQDLKYMIDLAEQHLETLKKSIDS